LPPVRNRTARPGSLQSLSQTVCVA
jgi:hypothetical protein